MNSWIPIILSVVALGVSVLTAWLTLLQVGKLRMTQPTIVFLGSDGAGAKKKKIFLRTLLYSTSRKGQVVESIHVNVQRGETRQNFSFWAYVDQAGKTVRGSGIFVGQQGVALSHHFLLPDDSDFKLYAGTYKIRVFAKRVLDKVSSLVYEFSLDISEGNAKELEKEGAGIFFDWGPDQQAYQGRVDFRISEKIPE